jgi:hypothetical protein
MDHKQKANYKQLVSSLLTDTNLGSIPTKDLLLLIEKACDYSNALLYQVACQAIESSNINHLTFDQTDKIIRTLTQFSNKFKALPGKTDI